MSDSAKSHYEVLGLKNDASFLEIKSQYRKLLLQNHPDKQDPQNCDDTVGKFLEVENAWRILSDRIKKQEYDAKLKEREIGQSAPLELEIWLHDMLYDYETSTYRSDCRCGGEYAITEEQLLEGFNVVPCTSCSLQVQVN